VDRSAFSFSYPTISGRFYQPKVRDSLTAGQWENLGPEVEGDGTTKTAIDTWAQQNNSTRRFYRLEVRVP
jgi:hypothetical protein